MSSENDEIKKDKTPQEEILEAFGLSKGEYEIENLANIFELNEEKENESIKENDIYCISPKQPYIEKLPIRQIPNPDIFNKYNLVFKHFIFEVELLIQQKTITKSFHFMECTFKKQVNFDNSTFHGMVLFNVNDNNTNAPFKQSVFESTLSCKNSTFNDRVDFSKTTFNTMVSFQGTTFNEYVHFKEVKFNGKSDFSDVKFKSGAVFSGARFHLTADFRAAHFSSHVWFQQARFCDGANFQGSRFEKVLEFNKSKFKGNMQFQRVGFYGLTRFSDVKFYGQVIFQGSGFKERAFFSKAKFQEKAILSNLIFEHNAYFDEVKFLGEVDFNKSEFYKTAYFYGTKFQEFPNFIQAIFNENVNFTNTELNIDFDKAREKIKETYKDRKREYNERKHKENGEYKEEPKKYKIANEFRDSFRNIKSALIKDNNMLDASNYHRVELYCKELELAYKKKEEPQNSTTRDFIDKIQLYCYRVTSDHHTDLLLILNNIICLIAWFGCMCFGLSFFHKGYFSINLSDVFKALGTLFVCLVFLVISLCFILECYKNFSRDTFKIRKLLSKSHSHYNCFRIHVIFFSYLIVAFILAVKPTLILPIFGQLIDKESYGNFPAFTSLSIAYAILMFLLIFSLQKTARKNTIVPS